MSKDKSTAFLGLGLKAGRISSFQHQAMAFPAPSVCLQPAPVRASAPSTRLQHAFSRHFFYGDAVFEARLS